MASQTFSHTIYSKFEWLKDSCSTYSSNLVKVACLINYKCYTRSYVILAFNFLPPPCVVLKWNMFW